MQEISIIDAKKHNLKNISLKIPKRTFIAVTGVSGSGKSTLAYDTIFQEGQRKYLESLSVYARQFIKSLEKPEVQSIKGISPTISIDQKHSSYYYNSTVGTISEVSQYLRLLYARLGQAHCPGCGRRLERFSIQKLYDHILKTFKGRLVYLLAPVVKNRKGQYRALFERFLKRGFLKTRVDGRMHYLESVPPLDRHVHHHIDVLIDALEVTGAEQDRLKESISLTAFEGDGEMVLIADGQEHFFSDKLYCSACNMALREPQPAAFSFNSPLGACRWCHGTGVIGDNDTCRECGGSGLNRNALSFRFRERNIFELGEMEIGELLDFFEGLRPEGEEKKILAPILPQVGQRLRSFVKLNLGYMSLNRKIGTLSGGELQRTRLVSQIGFSLSGIIYILDEPSIGMHISEQKNLIRILKELKKRDNTILVVEHDESTIKAADYIVDLGPGSGEAGGDIVYAGWYKDFRRAAGSLTADYIFKRKEIDIGKKYAPDWHHFIHIDGIAINNIRDLDARIPLGALTVVTGVSGSGKSSLINDAFYPIIKSHLDNSGPGSSRVRFSGLKLDRPVDRILMADQTAIGKNSRSCPATYVNLMPLIRDLFAGLPEARMRGYNQSRFSFNVAGGRCEACNGLGVKKLEMSFLPHLEVPCPVCKGRRYNTETFKVKYRGLSIADVLELTAHEAYGIFRNIPLLARKLKILLDVGLGYLKLGQSSVSLSGGESQRIKLSRELARVSNKRTVYLLDEPTIGLHFHDIQKLIDVWMALIARGDTVVVIEHNLEIIRAADYIIDLGPGGGNRGGQVVYQGPLAGILACDDSITSRYLKEKVRHAVG
jgi:excinuclease ABC subunit A